MVGTGTMSMGTGMAMGTGNLTHTHTCGTLTHVPARYTHTHVDPYLRGYFIYIYIVAVTNLNTVFFWKLEPEYCNHDVLTLFK